MQDDFYNKILVEPLTEKYVLDVVLLENKIFGTSDKQKIETTLSSKNLKYFVLLLDEKVIGFFECLLLAPEAELYDIAVDENFRRKGFGKLLLTEFEKLAKSQDCNTLLLEVNKINKPAIKLYKNSGFEKYAERKNYYGDNDAILLRKKI